MSATATLWPPLNRSCCRCGTNRGSRLGRLAGAGQLVDPFSQFGDLFLDRLAAERVIERHLIRMGITYLTKRYGVQSISTIRHGALSLSAR